MVKYLTCKNCFVNWSEKTKLFDSSFDVQEDICDFCKNNPSSIDLAHHMIDIFDKTHLSDFNKIFKHILKHIKLE